MLEGAQFFLALIGAVAGGIGAYVAVRVEVAKLSVQVAHAMEKADAALDDADGAHKRIDRIMRYRGGEDTTRT